MSGGAKSSSGTPRELLCSRCYKRESCVQCCGTRYCLRHFHTSNHSSDHPQKAIVMNRRALDDQLPAFREMWREAFQSVADDVGRLSRDVSKRVEDDPLASIGMALKPVRNGKNPERNGKNPEHQSSGSASSATKRRRKEKQEKEAAAAAAVDPFARRRTRPKSYWAVGHELDAPEEAKGSAADERAAAIAAAAPRAGEYQCESCESVNTSFDIIGGAAVGTRKAETFGKKDAPELILRVLCHACGNNWLEER
ncbi:unnamed protein product [Ectocarpus sp. 12 AP-2014]